MDLMVSFDGSTGLRMSVAVVAVLDSSVAVVAVLDCSALPSVVHELASALGLVEAWVVHE